MYNMYGLFVLWQGRPKCLPVLGRSKDVKCLYKYHSTFLWKLRDCKNQVHSSNKQTNFKVLFVFEPHNLIFQCFRFIHSEDGARRAQLHQNRAELGLPEKWMNNRFRNSAKLNPAQPLDGRVSTLNFLSQWKTWRRAQEILLIYFHAFMGPFQPVSPHQGWKLTEKQ